ncbi:MAG: hypothetical protein IKQ17_14270 [Kiritimatiellae bacterium]|nr:hypothetical protein [Kiritimatiellia bacterium]
MKALHGSMDLKDIIILGVVVVAALIGWIIYSDNAKRKAIDNLNAARAALEAREKEEQAERERRLKEEEEFERKKREARLAKEREDAARESEERERKRLAAEAEAELRRKQSELAKWKAEFLAAKEGFAKEFALARDVPPADKPRTVSSRQVFWCAFSSFPDEKKLYRVEAEPGGKITVVAHSMDAAPETVDSVRFAERLKTERSATVTERGIVFVTGVKPPTEVMFAIPERGCDFRIAEANLSDFYSAFVALGMKVPDMRFKVRLRSDNGKMNLAAGEVNYDGVLPRSNLEDAMRAKLGKTAKGASTGSKVKRPKFQRTAVLYDGEYIKEQIGGPTLVPREYRYIGTNRHKKSDYNGFHAKWKALYDRAVKEDEREQEIEIEYRAALERERLENEQKQANARRIAEKDDTVEAALSKCKLVLIQMSR